MSGGGEAREPEPEPREELTLLARSMRLLRASVASGSAGICIIGNASSAILGAWARVDDRVRARTGGKRKGEGNAARTLRRGAAAPLRRIEQARTERGRDRRERHGARRARDDGGDEEELREREGERERWGRGERRLCVAAGSAAPSNRVARRGVQPWAVESKPNRRRDRAASGDLLITG